MDSQIIGVIIADRRESIETQAERLYQTLVAGGGLRDDSKTHALILRQVALTYREGYNGGVQDSTEGVSREAIDPTRRELTKIIQNSARVLGLSGEG